MIGHYSGALAAERAQEAARRLDPMEQLQRGVESREADHDKEIVELLRAELDTTLATVDSLDRKLALIGPVIGAGAALLVPGSSSLALQVQLLAAATLVVVLTIALSIAGLWARDVEIGPKPGELGTRAGAPYASYYADVARSLAYCVAFNLRVIQTKGKHFNLGAVAATCAILLFLIARLLEVQ
jgi:hypothetical protein